MISLLATIIQQGTYQLILTITELEMRLDDDSDDYFSSIANARSIDPSPPLPEVQFLEQIYNEPRHGQDTIEEFKEKIKEKRNMIRAYNLRDYPYSRAHHYHFPLDTFQRVENQPTYALDYQNSFLATFTQEDKLYRGHRLGDILNRVAFTCPLRTNEDDAFPQRNHGSSKNEAHEYLFSIEDEKYEVDRQLITLRKILCRLGRLPIEKLSLFQIIRRNSSLCFLLSQQTPLSEKRKRLQRVISGIDRFKKMQCHNWSISDSLFFYSSIQQRLHDQTKRQKYIENRIDCLVKMRNRHAKLKENAKASPQAHSFRTALTKIFTFYQASSTCLSPLLAQEMLQHSQEIANRMGRDFPLGLFDLGTRAFREKVNNLLMNVVRRDDSEMEQNVGMTISRLFREDCSASDDFEEISLQESKELTFRKIEQIREILSKGQNNQKVIDQYIDLSLLSPRESTDQAVSFLSLKGYKIVLNEAEAQILLYYTKLCKLLEPFQTVLTLNDELVQILSSPHFSVLVHGFIGRIQNCQIGKSRQYIKKIVGQAALSMFTQGHDQDGDGSSTLEFQFCSETGLAALREVEKQKAAVHQGKDLTFFKQLVSYKSESQVVESLSDEEEEQLSSMENYPFKKRVKEDPDCND